jgi:MFS family permease
LPPCSIYLPFLSGAIADRVGYRQALMLALLLLTVGYAGLGLFPLKHLVLIPMALVMFGGALGQADHHRHRRPILHRRAPRPRF